MIHSGFSRHSVFSYSFHKMIDSMDTDSALIKGHSKLFVIQKGNKFLNILKVCLSWFSHELLYWISLECYGIDGHENKKGA
jgi:hypothetical protein